SFPTRRSSDLNRSNPFPLTIIKLTREAPYIERHFSTFLIFHKIQLVVSLMDLLKNAPYKSKMLHKSHFPFFLNREVLFEQAAHYLILQLENVIRIQTEYPGLDYQ